MKKYPISILLSIVVLITPSCLHGMEEDTDSPTSISNFKAITPFTTPEFSDTKIPYPKSSSTLNLSALESTSINGNQNPHVLSIDTSPSSHTRSIDSNELIHALSATKLSSLISNSPTLNMPPTIDVDSNKVTNALSTAAALSSLTADPNHPFWNRKYLDLIESSNISEYQTNIKACVLDAAEEKPFRFTKYVYNASALGALASIILWIRNINPQQAYHDRFITGLEGPAVFAVGKALMSAGSTVMMPLLATGAGAFIWHEFKRKVELEIEVKELNKKMKTQEKRIVELTSGLKKSEEALDHAEKLHEETTRTLVNKQYHDLEDLDKILRPILDHAKHNKDESKDHCKAIGKTINDLAMPLIKKSSDKLKNIKDGFEEEQHGDNKEKKSTMHKLKQWFTELVKH